MKKLFKKTAALTTAAALTAGLVLTGCGSSSTSTSRLQQLQTAPLPRKAGRLPGKAAEPSG